MTVRARSATEDDGRQTNDQRNPSSFVCRPSSLVVFEVADSGVGIPPDELPHVFERFYRTDKARARETGGSGLGLAIVQRLVEMQGGRIWAQRSATTTFSSLCHRDADRAAAKDLALP